MAAPTYGLGPAGFQEAFPFHIAFNRELRVIGFGPSLAKIAPQVRVGEHLFDHLTVSRPHLPNPNLDTLKDHLGQIFIFSLKADDTVLRGQLIQSSDPETWLFLGSPWFTELSALSKHGLYLNDFANHDATLDLLQLLSSQELALDDNRRLVAELSRQRGVLRQTNTTLEQTVLDLRAAEAKYRTVVENLHEVVFRSDAAGVITLLNPAWKRITGVDVADSIGRRWPEFIDARAHQQVWGALVPLLEGHQTEATFEVPFVNTSGYIHTCELSVQTIVEHGELTGMSGTIRDITEQRIAELENLARDDLLASVAEAMRCLLVTDGEAESLATALKVMGQALLATRVCICVDGANTPLASWAKPGFDTASTILLPESWHEALAAGDRVGGVSQDLPQPTRELLQAEDVQAILAVPVQHSGLTFGHIRFDYRTEGRKLSPSELSIVELFCSGVAGRITRKRAEQEVVASELRKAKILESALDCVMTIDASGAIVDFNPAAEQTFGYKRADVLGRDMAELIIPAHLRSAHHQGLEVANTTGQGNILGRRIEVPAVCADGREICAELSVVRIEVAGQPMYTAYLRDITEAKRVVERLRLLESVSVNARDPVLIVNAQQGPQGPEILYVNEAFTLLTGYSQAYTLGRPVNFLRAGLDTSHQSPLIDALASQSPAIVELMILSKLGRPLWVELSAAPVRDDDGTIIHRIGLFRDVSQQKQATAAMQRARDLAEAANRTKSQFLANMSHELRTPLNAVIGFGQVLAQGMFGALNDRQARYVNNILVSGRHLLQLINDILDLSKVESGRVVLERRQVAIPVAIGETASIVATLLGRKEITLAQDYPEDLPNVFLDEAKFKQVMYNLLSNAIKFTPVGGSIHVSAQIVEPGDLPRRVQVSVQDNGIGIKPEDQAKIFGEFEQVDSSYTREQEGTGLGLALVAKLTRLHGGHVSLKSSGIPGEGSCFIVEFPVDQPRASEHSDATKVVIVSDEANDNLHTALEQAGFFVLWSQTHEHGLQLVVDHLPQLVLLGRQARTYGSLRFIESLRDVPATTATPVVLFDAHHLSDEERYLVSTQVQVTTPGAEIRDILDAVEVLQQSLKEDRS